VDSEGNAYVAGTFSGAADFNREAGAEDSKTPLSAFDTFVTRYNRDGRYAWTQTISGAAPVSPGALIAAGGAVFVGVTSQATAVGIGGGVSGSSGPFLNGYVVALDASSGAARGSFGTSGVSRLESTSGDVSIRASAVLGTTLFVAGKANANLRLNNGIGPTLRQSDGFIAALDTSSGQLVTSFSGDGFQTFGGDGDEDSINALSLSGGLYAGGTFEGSAGLGGATGVTASGVVDGFVVRLDPATGAPVTAFSGDGIQVLKGSAIDTVQQVSAAGGRIFVAGSTSSSDLGVGALGSLGATSLSAYLIGLRLDGSLDADFGGGGVTFLQDGSGTSESSTLLATVDTVFWGFRFEAALGGALSNLEAIVSSADGDGAGLESYVMALDLAGTRKDIVGPEGALHLVASGSENMFPAQIAAGGGHLYLAGSASGAFSSANPALDGIGPFDTATLGSAGFLIDLFARDLPTTGATGSTALLVTTAEAASSTCPAGGTRVSAGVDTNANGTLDASEITSQSSICNGTNGNDGANGADGTPGADGDAGASGKGGCGQTSEPWLPGLFVLLFFSRFRLGVRSTR
jgi:hypothetical protein